MLTVGRTLSIVADGLRSVYGDEAQAVARFVVRQCQERRDRRGEKVWNRVLDHLRSDDDPGTPRGPFGA